MANQIISEEEKLEALYSKIDVNTKNRFQTYCTEAKIMKIDATNNQRKLIEVALNYYMDTHPIISQKEISPNT